MPLFALSDNTSYVDYTKLKSYGFPLLFMPQNKHIYFGSPNIDNTCYNFSCAELSLENNPNTYKGDIMINSGEHVKKFVSGIQVDDHKITCTYNSITLPTATNGLIYSQLDNTIGHFNELPPDSISALGTVSYLESGSSFYSYIIDYDCNGHITGYYTNTVQMPKSEITLSSLSTTYKPLTSSTADPYIQFIERGTSTKPTSKLQMVGSGLVTTNGDSSNKVTINVDENAITTTYNYGVKGMGVYLLPDTYNVSSNNSYLILQTGSVYFNCAQYTATSSGTQNGQTDIILFKYQPTYNVGAYTVTLHIGSGSITNMLVRYYYDGNTLGSLTLPIDSSTRTGSFTTNNKGVLYIVLLSCAADAFRFYASISAINGTSISYENCSNNGKLWQFKKNGVVSTNTHGGQLMIGNRLPTHTDIKTFNGIIASKANNDTNDNEILLTSYHHSTETSGTLSYIPKSISYDMFGHITNMEKTSAGIMNIISLSQTLYDNLSSPNKYTLYLITS